MARLVEEALDEAFAAPERRHGLAHRGIVEVGDLLDGAGHLEPSATATVGRLDRDRQPVLLREGHHLVRSRDRVLGARDERGVGLRGDVPRLDLVAQGVDGAGPGADPDEAGVDDGLGEAGVLGEEAVTGVDRVRARLLRDVDQLLLDEVALGRGRATQRIRLISDLDVQRVPIRLRIDRHRPDT